MSLQDDILWSVIVADYAARDTGDAEYARAADAIIGSLFPQQQAFVLDKCRRVCALCPRRSGKSWAAMSRAFDTCLRKPNRRAVIITLTLGHAKSIYWTEMQNFAAVFGLQLKWNSHELKVYFRNGSTITLVGGESRAEVEKLRGSGYDLVIIDECKSFLPSVLQYMLDDVIAPALNDRLGTVCMIGTPGNLLKGMFYLVTYPGLQTLREDGKMRPYSRTASNPEAYWRDNPSDRRYWSRHAWTAHDNIRLPHLWEAMLEKKDHDGWPDDHPVWRRESLGEWVPSESVYVYEFANLIGSDPGRVTWTPGDAKKSRFGLPEGEHDWRFVCGLDFGFNDDWAIVVFAFSDRDNSLWHVFDYKTNHQDLDAIGEKLMQVNALFGGFDAIVGDFGGLGLLLLETLNNRYGLNIEKAEKKEKFDHIELLNSDFMGGKVKIMAESDYAVELAALQWNVGDDEDRVLLARSNKLRENPTLPNHLCDAGLYAWRFCMHHWAQKVQPGLRPGTPEYDQHAMEQAMQRLLDSRHPRSFAGPRSVLEGWN